MGFTVEDAMKLPAFNEAELRAGKKGISNIVKCVDVMEVPDVDNWMRANEILLTTAFAIKNDVKAQEDLIRKLAAAGAAALCIKPGRFIDRIPEKMIKDAEEVNFPLIQLPIHVPYIDIITQILGEILSERSVALETINKIHNSLTEVVLSGEGLQAICEKLREITGAAIAVFEREKRVIAFSGGEGASSSTYIKPALIDELKKYEKLKHMGTNYKVIQDIKFIISPIRIEKSIYGYLVMCGESRFDDNINGQAIEQGSFVAALEFLKERNTQETKKHLMRDLVNDILEGSSNEETLKERGRYFGWNLESGMAVFAVDLSESSCKRKNIGLYLDLVKIAIKKLSPESIVVNKSDKIVVFVKPHRGEEWEDGDHKAYSHIKCIVEKIHGEGISEIEDLKVRTGIGRYYKSINQISKSYREALKALKIGKLIGSRESIIHYDDTEVYKFLMEASNREQLKQYSHATLKKLIEYDKQNGTDLMTTLEIYIKNGKRIDKTAEDLFVHRNTVRYRIDRIIDIMGIDMDDGEILFNIYFSLKALNAYDASKDTKS